MPTCRLMLQADGSRLERRVSDVCFVDIVRFKYSEDYDLVSWDATLL